MFQGRPGIARGTWRRDAVRRLEVLVPFGAALQPSQRSLEGVPGHALVRAPGHHVVEGHRDVGAQGPLDLRGALRREPAAAAVDVTLELDAVLVHAPEARERAYLEADRIGQQRPI